MVKAARSGELVRAPARAAREASAAMASVTVVWRKKSRGEQPRIHASRPCANCQGSGAYYGSRAGGILVYADRNEIVFDGIGDCRSPAVGKRDRCAVRAQHGKKVDALWCGLQRRKQPLGGVGIKLLDVSHFAVSKLRELASGHQVARLGIFSFEIFHRLSTPSMEWSGEATSKSLIKFQSAATIPTFSTR